jgi:hypothetical protein
MKSPPFAAACSRRVSLVVRHERQDQERGNVL